MPRRNALIVVRADIAAAVRSAIAAELGFDVRDWLSATPMRRSGDAPNTTSHYAAHGPIPDRLWDALRDILATETAGIRDAVDWQGRGSGGSLADARWAVATDADDIVAAYRMSSLEATNIESPRTALAAAGLVFRWVDQ